MFPGVVAFVCNKGPLVGVRLVGVDLLVGGPCSFGELLLLLLLFDDEGEFIFKGNDLGPGLLGEDGTG